MEINLRKARKLEAKINQVAAKQAAMEFNLSILASSTDEEAIGELTAAKARLTEQIQNSLSLTSVRYSIRRKIEQANEGVGVNQLMNLREQIQSKLAYYNTIEGLDTCSQREMLDLLSAKRKALEKGNDNFYGKVNISIQTLSEEEKNALTSQAVGLRRELEEIEEQLIQKNVGAKITLSEDEVALLQSNGLL
jgi:hypothetical protein